MGARPGDDNGGDTASQGIAKFGKRRHADILLGQGKKAAEVVKALGVTELTDSCWCQENLGDVGSKVHCDPGGAGRPACRERRGILGAPLGFSRQERQDRKGKQGSRFGDQRQLECTRRVRAPPTYPRILAPLTPFAREMQGSDSVHEPAGSGASPRGWLGSMSFCAVGSALGRFAVDPREGLR